MSSVFWIIEDFNILKFGLTILVMTPFFFVHGVKLIHNSLFKSNKIIFITTGWSIRHGSIMSFISFSSITFLFFNRLIIMTIIISFTDPMVIIDLDQSYLVQCCCTDFILRFYQYHHFSISVNLKILNEMRYENNIRNSEFNLPPYFYNVFFDHANLVNFDPSQHTIHEHEVFFSQHCMVESPWCQQPNHNKCKDSLTHS